MATDAAGLEFGTCCGNEPSRTPESADGGNGLEAWRRRYSERRRDTVGHPPIDIGNLDEYFTMHDF